MKFTKTLFNRRVISLLPSATDMICTIPNGKKMMVARSHECNWPLDVQILPIVTGQKSNHEWTSAKDVDKNVSAMLANNESLYTINTNIIKSLKPDIILTQDLCNVCAIDLPTVERLASTMTPSPQVISLNPNGIDDVLDNIHEIGLAVGLENEANDVIRLLTKRIQNAMQIAQECVQIQGETKVMKIPTVGFVEWSDPIYVGGHWTPQLIHAASAQHLLNLPSSNSNSSSNSGSGSVIPKWSHAGKSFAVSNEDFAKSDPDFIIICPCGLNLQQAEREAWEMYTNTDEHFKNMRAVREGRVVIVDGDAMFNRPGPRVVDALEFLVSLLHGMHHHTHTKDNSNSSNGNRGIDSCVMKARELMPTDFPYKFISFRENQ